MTQSLLKRIAISICPLLFLASCQKENGMNVFKHTNVNGWSQKDTLLFDIPASDIEADYDLQIQARITRSFEYKDLWLIAEQTYIEDSTQCVTQSDSLTAVVDSALLSPTVYTHSIIDTIHISFVDENGNLTGQGRDMLEYQQPIRFVKMRKGMNGAIRVRHIMNERTIKGVHDIGIELLPLQTDSTSI